MKQLAIGTEDIYKTASACELIGGGKTVTAPGTLSKINTKIYAIKDPDGWKTVGCACYISLEYILLIWFIDYV